MATLVWPSISDTTLGLTAFPFDRDLFSRADRIDNALNVNVANN